MRKELIKLKNQLWYFCAPFVDLLSELFQLTLTFTTVITMMGALLAIDACALSYLWDAVIPKVFPYAVEAGWIAKTMDFCTMFLICLGIFILKPANLKTITKKGDDDE